MAYIESHQSLGQHPKLKRLARRLNCSLPTAAGYLHYLWWWVLDYAPDGDVSRFDAETIADGCLWEGEPEAFHAALEQAGFLDPEGTIHDWGQYGGKYVQKRAADAERKRQSRRTGAAVPPASAHDPLINEGHPMDIRTPSNGHPADGASNKQTNKQTSTPAPSAIGKNRVSRAGLLDLDDLEPLPTALEKAEAAARAALAQPGGASS